MTRNELNRLMLEISPLDKTASDAAQQYLDSLSKPPGSLGGLERIACQLAGITGQVANTLDKRRVVVLAADNGVVAEGVSSAPQSVTAMQVASTLNGVTGVAVLAQCFGSEVSVIDLGIAQELWHPKLLNRAIRRGTGNIAVEPAMTTQQALEAVAVGIAAARTAKEDGCKVLGVGEIGIGNTTTSGAVLAALLGLRGSAIDTVCGRGAGLDEAGFAKKLATVHRALETNHPDATDPVEVLAKVGGLDLAAMTGVFLGAARYRLPVVIDGFISVVAALAAQRLCPAAAGYFFASHRSGERGYTLAADALGLTPCLELGMRLGEGSGCPLMFSVMDGACAIMNHMATFAQVGIAAEYMDKVKAPEAFGK